MRAAAVLGLLLVVLGVAGLHVGCESIAGIKDHTFPAQCDPYCVDVQKCPSTKGSYSSLYTSKQTCLGICTALDPGGGNEDTSNNTVACRERQLTASQETNCQAAGPGGGGTCGSDCDAYCQLLHRICPDFFTPDFPTNLLDAEAACRQACTAGMAEVPYSVDAPIINAADTLQCRLWHLSTATVQAGHCEHAQFHPNKTCGDDPNGANFCAHFCTVNQAACKDDNKAYDSTAECMAICAALPAGNAPDDQTGNSRACRLWHSYSALEVPVEHCPHTTAGGDGKCSADNCEPYCQLIGTQTFQNACPVESAQAVMDCKARCGALPGAGAGQWTSVDGRTGTVPCLLRHVGRVLAGLPRPDAGPTECQMATSPDLCQ